MFQPQAESTLSTELRSNPFAASRLRPGSLPYLFAGSRLENIAAVAAKLASQDGWGQITGSHGSGKSTLLRQLENVIEELGYAITHVQLNDQQRALPTLPKSKSGSDVQHIIFVDGYEQLSWWRKLRLRVSCRRQGFGLVVTAHQDVGLPTLFETTMNESLAKQVISRLLEKAMVTDPSQLDRLTIDLATKLKANSNNLRDVLFELYDQFQTE